MSTVPPDLPPETTSGDSGGEPSGDRPDPRKDTGTVDLSGEAVAPLDVDGVAVATWGTVAWAVAGLVGLVFFRTQLSDSGRSWWLLVCLAGVLIGIGFSVYTRRRREVYARASQVRRRHDESDPTESGS